MGTQVLVFRKFLEDHSDSFVSVTASKFDTFNSVNLALHDTGDSTSLFTFIISNRNEDDLDEDYSTSLEQLETIKAAVNACIDEIIDYYGDSKLRMIEDAEEKRSKKKIRNEGAEDFDPWYTEESVPF